MKTLNSTPDEKLIKEIKCSNGDAFKILYFRYHEIILKFLYHRLSSEELSKDFTQEVFTRVWQNRKDLYCKSVKAYLFRIANNLVIDHFRKQSSKEIRLSEDILQNKSPADNSLETQIIVKSAIANLPEKIRITFTLNRYDGLKYHEIAEVLKISVKTVESRISKALQLLKKELN